MQEYKPQNIADIPTTEQILYSTFRITAKFRNNQYAYGTGFVYNMCKREETPVPCIITNKHVINDAVEIEFPFRLLDSEGNYLGGKSHFATIVNPSGTIRKHPDPNVDLVLINLVPIIAEAEKRGYRPYFIPVDESLLPTTDEMNRFMVSDTVLMVGYPNGLWDSVNNLPLVRKGILSSLPKYDYEGKKEFLVDMACLTGSSGSPVFYYDINNHSHNSSGLMVKPKIKLLGVLHGGPEYSFQNEFFDVNISLNAPILNLGYVIKYNRILELEEIIKPELNN